jgi:hypothetical protein
MEGIRVFAMEDRQTRLLTALPTRSYTRFVLFPLPAGAQENREYLQKVLALLPTRDLRTLFVEGHEFITGPITDLPLLFPGVASEGAEGVSTLRQSPEPPVNSRVHQPSGPAARR